MLLGEGLALWRGDPLADLAASEELRQEGLRLVELRVQAVDWRIEADLHCGRHDGVIAELRQLVAAHPLRERLWMHLMLALYRSGLQGEALAAYQRARRILREELGVNPGRDLRGLPQRILSADRSLEAAAPGAVRSGTADIRPRPVQFPADVPDFVGRDLEVRLLRDGLLGRPDDRGGPARVAAVVGAAGTGKSALCLQVAHRFSCAFPDGQLYADLGGAAAPCPSADLLARFLRELGVPDGCVPAAEAERAAFYRSLIAHRTVLIVPDDARDMVQVRSLLPGAGRSAVLVSSRYALAGLPGALFVELGMLSDIESADLFAAIVGGRRVAAEPVGTRRLLASCGGLPLAIRIAAARRAMHPDWSIAGLSDLLQDERRRLSALTAGDLAVRSSFAVTCHALPSGDPDPAFVFRVIARAAPPDRGNHERLSG